MSQIKQIFKLNILKKLLADENSCVSLVQSTRVLPLPPFFLNDMKSGILYFLNTMLKKYDRSLGGIVIGYQNIRILMDENTGIIPIGTSEMEVNISVEFYIFQPKIGSYLEGVINKKSNNHIGCLVHQYFNATILKPEDVLYEDWICKDFNVDDKIIFEVKDLDFTTLLPYIEGIYDGSISLVKVESKKSGNCDKDNVIVHNVNKTSHNVLLHTRDLLEDETNADGVLEDNFLEREEDKNKFEIEVKPVNVSKNQEESQSSLNLKIKKHKKKKGEMEYSSAANVFNKESEEKSSEDKDDTSNRISTELQIDESTDKKKKKKKKRKKDESNGGERPIEVENVQKESQVHVPCNIFESLAQLEDENSNDFVKGIETKKEKKKKKKGGEESFPNVNTSPECLLSQDMEENILYSTQLDPALDSKKMRISFCSPIPQSSTLCDKAYSESTAERFQSSTNLNNQDNVDTVEKGIKKKHKKRKREKRAESEDSPASKKIKLSDTSLKEEDTTTKEVNSGGGKSILQRMMEELCQEQLNRVREEFNMSSSDRESLKGRRKKKKKDIERSESLKVCKNTESNINEQERKSELQSSFEELLKQELHRMKEELIISDKETSKESTTTKVKIKKQKGETPKEKSREESCKVKENINAQISSTNAIEKKSDVKSLVDELYTQEINRTKEELNTSCTRVNIKKKKKKKSVTDHRETSNEKTHNSLYDKLLNEAKNLMVSQEYDITGSLKKKKDNELSDSSKSSSRKKDSKKKSEHNKEKLKDCHQLYRKYKNGSMYDTATTPEKINPDKSLFSDSEQSHTSPPKRRKEVNGIGLEKSMVQNMLDEFYKEEINRLKNESDRESLKGLNRKSEVGEKSQIPSGKESLYEKLLKEAKSLVEVREASFPVKKE